MIISQQDNALRYKTCRVLEWFQVHENAISLLSWPANSPNIDIMEHLLFSLKITHLGIKIPTKKNLEELDSLAIMM